MEGSTPTVAKDTIFAIGFKPNSVAFSFIINTAAAPSFNPEALPAVTVPFLSKTGFSEPILSKVVPCLGNSSASNESSCFLDLIIIGDNSFLK